MNHAASQRQFTISSVTEGNPAVTVAKTVRNVVREAALCSRRELVFLLGGQQRGVGIQIDSAVAVKNNARSTSAFIIRQADWDAARRSIGKNFIGLLHTHSKTLAPSKADFRHMQNMGFLWLIGCMKEGDLALAAFFVKQGSVIELELKVRSS